MVELLFSQVDPGFRHKVNLALLQFIVERIDNGVEPSGTDLARFVHESHAEELAFSTLVRPRLDVRLLSDSRLDCPGVRVRAETLYRIDGTARAGLGTPGLALLLLWRFLRHGNRRSSSRDWFRASRFGVAHSRAERNRVTDFVGELCNNMHSKDDYNAFAHKSDEGTARKRLRVPLGLEIIASKLFDTDYASILKFPVFQQRVELGGQHGLHDVLPVGYDCTPSVHGSTRADLLGRYELDDGLHAPYFVLRVICVVDSCADTGGQLFSHDEVQRRETMSQTRAVTLLSVVFKLRPSPSVL